MAIEQLADGRWKVDIEPIKGKRCREILKTKAEAQRFEASCRPKVVDNPSWTPKPTDTRRLTELIAAWFHLHGHSLRDGGNAAAPSWICSRSAFAIRRPPSSIRRP
ncbi:hypothetical protein OH686_16965 [Pseudomonas sp. SO81]|nr:hypothetical protein OH686_16965 [Pseudomonas sp. SO81]